jgi:OmpA-OmpF porin, OOP family
MRAQRGLIFVIFPLLLVLLLAWLQRGDLIERDLQGQVSNLLKSKGVDWAVVKLDGRDAHLSGSALSKEQISEAELLVKSVNGIRTVSSEAALLPVQNPFTFSVKRDGERVVLNGYIPSEDVREKVITQAKLFSPNVDDKLVLARTSLNAQTWEASVLWGLQKLSLLPQGSFHLTDLAGSLEGKPSSYEAYNDFVRSVTDVPSGLTLSTAKIEAVELKPYVWSAKREETKLILSGFIPSEDARTLISTAAIAAVPRQVLVDDQMRVATTSLNKAVWQATAILGMQQLGRLKTGSVELKDLVLSVEGSPAGRSSFQAIQSALVALPQGVTLGKKQIEEPAVATLRYTMKRDDTSFAMSGLVPTESDLAETKKLAQDLILQGIFAIDNTVSVAPAGSLEGLNFSDYLKWSSQALARLKKGEIRLEGSTVSLSGEAMENDYPIIVEERIRKALPVGFTFSEFKITPTIVLPFVYRVQHDSKSVTLTGFYPDEASQKLLIDTVKQSFPGLPVKNFMQLAGGAPDRWLDAAKAMTIQVARLNAGTGSLIDKKVRIIGDTMFERAINFINTNLADSLPQQFFAEAVLISRFPGPLLGVEACQGMYASLLGRGTIQFEPAKNDIKPLSLGLLDNLVFVTQSCPAAKVEIGGHTDADGSDLSNTELSKRRAQAVVKYLTKSGVKEERLTAVGYGESRPIAPNNTKEGKAKNRRIEFQIKP